MNSWFGSDEMEIGYGYENFRVFLKETDIASSPASIFVFVDEHPATLQDPWFLVTMDDSMPFVRLPATRHQNGYCLNFADGHAERYHVVTAQVQIPETQSEALIPSSFTNIPPSNLDWIRLKQITTTQ